MTQVCSINDKDCNPAGQYWSCRDYFGISGYFCSVHFTMIQHDSYRNPLHPDKYEAIKLKQEEVLNNGRHKSK
jgi:hypothetical protein